MMQKGRVSQFDNFDYTLTFSFATIMFCARVLQKCKLFIILILQSDFDKIDSHGEINEDTEIMGNLLEFLRLTHDFQPRKWMEITEKIQEDSVKVFGSTLSNESILCVAVSIYPSDMIPSYPSKLWPGVWRLCMRPGHCPLATGPPTHLSWSMPGHVHTYTVNQCVMCM